MLHLLQSTGKGGPQMEMAFLSLGSSKGAASLGMPASVAVAAAICGLLNAVSCCSTAASCDCAGVGA